MTRPSIYLDYNATAPLRPAVREAMAALDALPLNPSSIHTLGRAAKKHLEDARKTIADAISVFPNEILFTASGTEANNMALRGFPERALLVSAVEHASILKLAEQLGASTLPVDSNGLLRLDILESQLAALNRPALVSVQLANNETGVIQPIAEIAAICRKYNALLHSDAVQALCKIPVDMGLLGADMLTLCAHKAGGPVGVGALVLRNDLAIKPMLVGGGQELGRRAGTEPLAAIAGFAALLRDAAPITSDARDALEAAILAHAPTALIHGRNAPRLPNTSSIAMPGVSSETQLMDFDLKGLCISAGSACSSGRIAPSHVLKAMDAPHAEATIRVSLGWATQPQDTAAFLNAWQALYDRLGKGRQAA